MIEKRILLQVNATVMAGLLILLAIQANTAGGIPFLMELGTSNRVIDMYEKAMNDTSLDPILLETMKKRQAELKVEVMEKEIRLISIPNVWIVELFMSPIVTLTFSMIFFITSTVIEFDIPGKMTSKLGLILSCVGFFVMLIAVLFMLLWPLG